MIPEIRVSVLGACAIFIFSVVPRGLVMRRVKMQNHQPQDAF
jgi:hypothetical protein